MPSTPTVNTDLENQLEAKLSDIEARKTEDAAKELAKSSGLSYVNLKTISINQTALTVIDEASARAGQIAVIAKTAKRLRIAVLDPNHPKTQELLSQLQQQGYTYELVLASLASLIKVWEKYSLGKHFEAAEIGVASIKSAEISALQKEIKDIANLKDKLAKMSVTQALNILVAGALSIDASDIHLEPEKDVVRLRYRIDGMLQDVVDLGEKDYPQILSRVKIISGLKINIHDTPQDGRFTLNQGKTAIEVRVSILPGAYGENIVMRLLDPRKIKQKLEDLGMRDDTLDTIKTLLKKTTGAIITTGPTGSGKTTTLYAFINQINAPDIKIITIEDPIEYHINGISQTQVDPTAGYTFANGLRSIVRQDPDVILVGEIRDAETADIAMQAALTGHTVFSTLHTNDASGTIPRLIDFNVNPVTIAPATNAAMAQRLVRRLCISCKKKSPITDSDLALLETHLKDLSSNFKVLPTDKVDRGSSILHSNQNLSKIGTELNKNLEIYYPQQCKECNFTGYKDRIGVYEVMVIDPELEKLIITSPSITDIKNFAIKKGMVTMLQDGFLKVLEGITSVEEVIRVIGE